MNLRDLQYIVAVAEFKNFTAAANSCAISQPTLSTQIKKLEEYLDVQLFTRESSQVEITDIGVQIVEIAKKINEDANHIKLLAKSASEPKVNKVTLGAFPTLASYVFPEYVFRLKQHFTDLKLTLLEEKTDNLVSLLASGKIDAALLAYPVEHDELEHAHLFDDPFFAAIPDNHALTNLTELNMNDLMQEKLLLLDEGHCLRSQVLALCAAQNALEDNFRAASLETLRIMVKNGLGVTLMPSVAINPDETDIRYIPVDSNPYRQIGLFWKHTHPKREFFKSIAKLLSYKPMQ